MESLPNDFDIAELFQRNHILNCIIEFVELIARTENVRFNDQFISVKFRGVNADFDWRFVAPEHRHAAVQIALHNIWIGGGFVKLTVWWSSSEKDARFL